MSWTPFFLKRVGPRGADTHAHLFCIGAKGNPELVRTGETDAEVLINGASSSDGGKGARLAITKVVDELNAVWDAYLRGEFHDERRALDTALVGKQVKFISHIAWDGVPEALKFNLEGKHGVVHSAYLDRGRPVYTVDVEGHLIEALAKHFMVV